MSDIPVLHEVRCGNAKCNSYWLGEAAEPMVFIEHVAKGEPVNVASPRDVRLCKACGRLNVHVTRGHLMARLRTAA